MSVDILSMVDAKAVTPRVSAETANRPVSQCVAAEEPADERRRQSAAEQTQAETIARLREARDLDRARTRRLIARLRQVQANSTQAADSVEGESIDQRMSRLLEREAKTRYATTERAQLAAMRELSQWNAKRLLNTHFRRNLWHATASKGVIVPLALMAGAGLLTVSQTAWPADVYPAILCFGLAAFWGWRYGAAVFAPLRRRSFMGRAWRAPGGGSPITLASASADLSVSANIATQSEKSTVADLLAELRAATAAETAGF